MGGGQIREFVKRFGYWRLARWGAMMAICFLIGAVVFRLATPVRVRPSADASRQMNADAAHGFVFDPNSLESVDEETVLNAVRKGLFRSASPLRDRPIADKTIERIRSQLALGCILEVDGESVAYIRVKDLGLKRCRIGESVEDLFTVLDIQEKSVAISIVDHRVTLSL